ncbi:UPF0184 protein CG14818 [Sitodiplosis mosellana]|uniref:UPF0184 protein CG14818 n=1 Tax=Sitodiplosis mosellana TaxID=263140 RepID=UPI0024446C62|nr:UPF0184 protein CG14818 [Sitodiplosis mosellana]
MAEQSDKSQEISEEQQLNEQLENICLEYQLLVNKSQEMAPKGTQSKKSDPNTENQIDDDDLEEIANVADNLDSLESALDVIEERADRIREQLLELLTSNREIRQSIQEENEKLRECQSKDNSNAETSSEPEDQPPTNEHQE